MMAKLIVSIPAALLAPMRHMVYVLVRYPKLGFAEEEIEAFISDFLEHAMTVSPSQVVVEEDPDDDRVIERALDRLRRQAPARSRGIRGHQN
jgi:hypothetical protein